MVGVEHRCQSAFGILPGLVIHFPTDHPNTRINEWAWRRSNLQCSRSPGFGSKDAKFNQFATASLDPDSNHQPHSIRCQSAPGRLS